MLPTKPAFSSQRVEHSIPVLSNFRLTDKAQLTSLHRHPTDYTFKPYDKTPDFFASFASKMHPYQYWQGNGVKNLSTS